MSAGIEGKRWTVTLDEDANGDLLLPIPDEVMAALDLGPGDDLRFLVGGDGVLRIEKAKLSDATPEGPLP